MYVEAQGGFRKGRSTTDSIFILHSIINSLISQNKKLYCAFLDLRKALDCVDRNSLCVKLVIARAVRVKIEQVCALLEEITTFCQDD